MLLDSTLAALLIAKQLANFLRVDVNSAERLVVPPFESVGVGDDDDDEVVAVVVVVELDLLAGAVLVLGLGLAVLGLFCATNALCAANRCVCSSLHAKSRILMAD